MTDHPHIDDDRDVIPTPSARSAGDVTTPEGRHREAMETAWPQLYRGTPSARSAGSEGAEAPPAQDADYRHAHIVGQDRCKCGTSRMWAEGGGWKGYAFHLESVLTDIAIEHDRAAPPSAPDPEPVCSCGPWKVGQPQGHLDGCERAAPDPEELPSGLDGERLAEAMLNEADRQIIEGPSYPRSWRGRAERLAAEYARLSPVEPTDKGDGPGGQT